MAAGTLDLAGSFAPTSNHTQFREQEAIWLDRRGGCVDKNRLLEMGRGEMAEWPKAAVC
jgi:hypothetical protein